MKNASVKLAVAFCGVASVAAAAPFPMSAQQNALTASTTAINPVANVYQEFKAKCSGNCTMIFPAVKNDTIILHVSCGFDVTPSKLFAVVLGTSGATPQAEESLDSFESKGSATTTSVNTASYFFVGKGQQPKISIVALSKVTGAICTLSGIHN